VPRFPAVQRDLALWFAESVPLQQIEDAVAAIRRTDPRLATLREFRLFDLYRPAAQVSSKFAEKPDNALLFKEKSLAFRVHIQDTDRTLSDADADASVVSIVEELGRRFGARLRQ